MKKAIYVIDKEGNYLCMTPKGRYTGENGDVRKRLIYWGSDSFEETKKRRIKNLFAIFDFIMTKIFSGDLKPKLVLEETEK